MTGAGAGTGAAAGARKKMNNSLTITRVDNGFILGWQDQINDKKAMLRSEVIENNGGEKETLKQLLYWIADFYGEHYDKYSKENINIIFDKKGSKINND